MYSIIDFAKHLCSCISFQKSFLIELFLPMLWYLIACKFPDCSSHLPYYVSILSSCRFFTYGDFPLATHLEQIDTEILQHFTKSSPSLSVPLEPRWSEPVSSHTVCTAACTEYSSVLYL